MPCEKCDQLQQEYSRRLQALSEANAVYLAAYSLRAKTEFGQTRIKVSKARTRAEIARVALDLHRERCRSGGIGQERESQDSVEALAEIAFSSP
jgi:hypothetical protein